MSICAYDLFNGLEPRSLASIGLALDLAGAVVVAFAAWYRLVIPDTTGTDVSDQIMGGSPGGGSAVHVPERSEAKKDLSKRRIILIIGQYFSYSGLEFK